VTVLVVATRLALAQAQRLGVHGCLENAIERAIAEHRKGLWAPGSRLVHPEEACVLDDRLLAIVVRDGFTPSGRKRWRCVRVVRISEPVNEKGDDVHDRHTGTAAQRATAA
jgi:hypothetical protein